MVFYHNINPTLLHIGPLEIRLYGVMYVVTFLLCYYWLSKASKENKINLTKKDIDDVLLWLTLGLIIGARLFEVIIYNPTFYFRNPLQILAIWKGGLSFHGGLLGIVIAAWLICKKKNIKILNLGDLLIVPLAFGQALVRFANYINGELYGRITNLPWGVNFANEMDKLGNPIFRHPSQLYEMGYDLVIFAVLFSLRNKKLKQGILLGLFLILYAIFRFTTEFVREPDGYVGPLTIGQALNIPMLAIGVYIIYKNRSG